uniref:Cyclic GMP-AMP synthase n=1 Tax=Leptobrachium leishanense TaxID=445787 RepID=A0A8C5R4Y0_9ANUR
MRFFQKAIQRLDIYIVNFRFRVASCLQGEGFLLHHLPALIKCQTCLFHFQIKREMAEGKNTPGRGGGRGRNRGSRGSKAGVNEENVEVPDAGAIASKKKSEAAHISISMKEAAGKPQETPTDLGTQRNGSNGRKPPTPRQNSSVMNQEHGKEKNSTASPQATTAVTKPPSNSKRNTKVPDNSPTVDDGTGKTTNSRRKNKDCVGKGSKPQEDSGGSCITGSGPNEKSKRVAGINKRKVEVPGSGAIGSVKKSGAAAHISISMKEAAGKPQETPTDPDTQRNGFNGRKPSTPRQNSSVMNQEHGKEKISTASPQARTVVTKPPSNSKRNIKVPDNSPTVDDGTGKTTNSRRKNKDCVGKGSKPQEDSGGRCVTGSSGPNETSKRVAVMKKLSLKKDDISAAALIVNDVLTRILKSDAITKNPIFAKIEAMKTGSYYEGLKIFRPNEFDIMLKIPIKTLELEQSDESGAFYKLSFKKLTARNPWNNYICKESKNILQSTVINNLRKIVKDVLGKTDNIKIIEKNHNSPAITFEINNKHETISVDFVLALEVKKKYWPEETNEGMKIDSWLGKKTKQKFRKEKIYFVAKKPRGVCNTEDLDDVWRLSFSNIEKKILTNHGNAKTCCERNEQKCCRKQCLKRLKCLLELIKQKSDKSLDVFSSYYTKTTLFHCCVKYPLDQDWKEEDLENCFDRLVEFFLAFLVEGNLPNFFIPSHNLISGISQNCLDLLCHEITQQKCEKYPVFKDIGADGTLNASSTFPLECKEHPQRVNVLRLSAKAAPIFLFFLIFYFSNAVLLSTFQ